MEADHQACLLLGSNLQPERNLPLAVRLLEQQLTVVRVSSVWETAPVGSAGPNFLNAALLARTHLDAKGLKDRVLSPIEKRLGRVRTADKDAARTIDLDLITFDGQLLDPPLWRHAHRAVPVAEVLPDYRSETDESLQAAASRLAATTHIQALPDVQLRASSQPARKDEADR